MYTSTGRPGSLPGNVYLLWFRELCQAEPGSLAVRARRWLDAGDSIPATFALPDVPDALDHALRVLRKIAASADPHVAEAYRLAESTPLPATWRAGVPMTDELAAAIVSYGAQVATAALTHSTEQEPQPEPAPVPEEAAPASEPAAAPVRQTFYAAFGAGYRRTEYDYDDMGISRLAARHPVFPDRIDGRGYVEVIATDMGRARYLADFYFERGYAGLHTDTRMWDDWANRSGYHSSPSTFKFENGGTLLLGRVDEHGLHWADPPTQRH